jgi:uncharacterized membrane protein YhiD involved in acid resistance
MMAIGDSLARGLGILGALAIIRFRFRFSNPKNIVYIFASLAIGISTGVYGFAIAFSGTIVFSLIAFALYFSPYGKPDYYDLNLSFSLLDPDKLNHLENLLLNYCDGIKILNISEGNEVEKFEYRLHMKKNTDQKILFRELNSLDYISNLRLNSRGSIDRI